jgi:hypothetical protein
MLTFSPDRRERRNPETATRLPNAFSTVSHSTRSVK